MPVLKHRKGALPLVLTCWGSQVVKVLEGVVCIRPCVQDIRWQNTPDGATQREASGLKMNQGDCSETARWQKMHLLPVWRGYAIPDAQMSPMRVHVLTGPVPFTQGLTFHLGLPHIVIGSCCNETQGSSAGAERGRTEHRTRAPVYGPLMPSSIKHPHAPSLSVLETVPI